MVQQIGSTPYCHENWWCKGVTYVVAQSSSEGCVLVGNGWIRPSELRSKVTILLDIYRSTICAP
jgi:hypothetical protein